MPHLAAGGTPNKELLESKSTASGKHMSSVCDLYSIDIVQRACNPLPRGSFLRNQRQVSVCRLLLPLRAVKDMLALSLIGFPSLALRSKPPIIDS